MSNCVYKRERSTSFCFLYLIKGNGARLATYQSDNVGLGVKIHTQNTSKRIYIFSLICFFLIFYSLLYLPANFFFGNRFFGDIFLYYILYMILLYISFTTAKNFWRKYFLLISNIDILIRVYYLSIV
nr:MAG TPA: hypothetical protein [Bacteriophage sp.]